MANLTREEFEAVMEKHLKNRVGEGADFSPNLARDILDGFLSGIGEYNHETGVTTPVEFGTPCADVDEWDEDAAREIVDEELRYWDEN